MFVLEYNVCVWIKLFKKTVIFISLSRDVQDNTNKNISPFLFSIPLLPFSFSLYLLFFLSYYHIQTHSNLKVILTSPDFGPWKSALRWPPYIDHLYFFCSPTDSSQWKLKFNCPKNVIIICLTVLPLGRVQLIAT